jgi:phosphoglycolate phosphatase-like HAD superfamily hydrolase
LLDPYAPARLGRLRQAVFDFDGTLSVLRQGWEGVMAPLMVECILGEVAGKGTDAELQASVESEVAGYIDRSTGLLTIRQMDWLVEAVWRYGFSEARTAAEYKALYLQRLKRIVSGRAARLASGEVRPADMMIAGAGEFIAGLASRGVRLYLASGTDHADVLAEAGALGLAHYFNGGIYGALDESEAHDKARLIRRILDEHDLHGDELMVIGDGPVEIREARLHTALALGVASDEVGRSGWNEHKVRRLAEAGADFLISDFSFHQQLLDYFMG